MSFKRLETADPKGEPNPEMSLRFIVPALEAALGKSVTFIERPSAEAIADLGQDAIVLVENTRFSKMETDGDPKMAQFLASLGDVFVMDAFSASQALAILAAAKAENCQIILPLDVVVATEFKANPDSRVCGLGDVAPNEMILDAGPETVSAITRRTAAIGAKCCSARSQR